MYIILLNHTYKVTAPKHTRLPTCRLACSLYLCKHSTHTPKAGQPNYSHLRQVATHLSL